MPWKISGRGLRVIGSKAPKALHSAVKNAAHAVVNTSLAAGAGGVVISKLMVKTLYFTALLWCGLWAR